MKGWVLSTPKVIIIIKIIVLLLIYIYIITISGGAGSSCGVRSLWTRGGRSWWKAGTGLGGRLRPVFVESRGLMDPNVNREQNLVIIVGATSPARPAPHSTGPNTRDLLLWTEDSGHLHPHTLSVERSEEEPTGHQDPQICLMSH